jgi:hypothetical protein
MLQLILQLPLELFRLYSNQGIVFPTPLCLFLLQLVHRIFVPLCYVHGCLVCRRSCAKVDNT